MLAECNVLLCVMNSEHWDGGSVDTMPKRGDAIDHGPPKERTCNRLATRLSHVYEGLSIYVCDIDHEGCEPWTDDDIEPLPHAEQARTVNGQCVTLGAASLSRPT